MATALISGCASGATSTQAGPVGGAGSTTLGLTADWTALLSADDQRPDERLDAGLGRRASASTSEGLLRSSRSPGARRTAAERGADALASLRFPYRELGYRVVFAAGRAGELGVTNRNDRRITIYVRPGQSALSLRATVAHELGHALDFTHGSAERRGRYREIRGLAAGRWFPCSRCDDLASPAGDFAEVFAASLVGTGDFRSRLAGPPSQVQLRALADLLTIPQRSAPAAATERQPAEREPAEEPESGLPLGLPGA